jgi:hypothetical protein
VQLHFQGSSHYKTECGAAFSLIAAVFLLSVAIIELYRLNGGINPALNQYEEYLDMESYPGFNPFKNGFDLAIGLKDNEVLPANIADVKAYHVLNGVETEIKLQFCNDSNF